MARWWRATTLAPSDQPKPSINVKASGSVHGSHFLGPSFNILSFDEKRTGGLMVRIMAVMMGLGLMLTQAQAVEIKLLASNALRSALQDIAPQFEQSSGHKLVMTFGSTSNLTASIDKGTPFDVTIMGADALDNLIKREALAGPRLDIARSGIGVAYRNGAPKPDISTAAALKATLLAANSISFNPQGLSGTHMLAVIERMGISAEVRSKLKVPAVSAAEDVAKGLAEIGMTQSSEILPHAAEGAELAGPLPPEVQLYTAFSIAVGVKAQQPDAAKLLVAFLRAPALVPVLKAKGLEPG
jgi:molybdate transport system substrate-binding protein